VDDLKRTRGARSSTNYPDAKEFLRRRREFLALLAKGTLGIGVAGVLGCDPGGGGAGDDAVLGGTDTRPQDSWTTGGVDMGPEEPDLTDTVDDARLGGLPDLPDPPETWDLSGIDTGPAEPDLEDAVDTHEWDGPAGVPPMPDTVDSK
jgi:hypothetical protein